MTATADDVIIATLTRRGASGATSGELASATNIPLIDTDTHLARLADQGYVAPVTVWVLTEEGEQRAD